MSKYSFEKLILIFGICIYLLLAFLAIIYYQERTIFADASFHLFSIIKDCQFAIQANRFGAIFTQAFPLICIKLDLPLKLAVISYSVGFIIYGATIFLLCFFITREKAFAGVVMLFSIFMVTETFYWIQSELLQGVVFVVFFFALISRIRASEPVSVVFTFLIITTIFFILFFHPLLVIVFVFFSLFMVSDKRFSSSRKLIWGSLIAVIIMTEIKNNLMTLPDYDSTAMESMKNFSAFFPHYFNLDSNINFLNDLIRKFYLLPVALSGILIFYLWQRQYIKLLLCFSFVFGYVALVNITHDKGGMSFYMESLYLPLSIFVLIPVMFDILPRFSYAVQLGVLSVIFITRIFTIQQTHIFYSERLAWEKNLLTSTENLTQKKLLIDEKHVPLQTLKWTWSTPYEFWLLSTIEKGETRSIMITDQTDKVMWAMWEEKSFITIWGLFKYHELPSRYFILNDTTDYQLYTPAAFSMSPL